MFLINATNLFMAPRKTDRALPHAGCGRWRHGESNSRTWKLLPVSPSLLSSRESRRCNVVKSWEEFWRRVFLSCWEKGLIERAISTEWRKGKPVCKGIQQPDNQFWTSSLTKRKQNLRGIWWDVESKGVGVLCMHNVCLLASDEQLYIASGHFISSVVWDPNVLLCLWQTPTVCAGSTRYVLAVFSVLTPSFSFQ